MNFDEALRHMQEGSATDEEKAYVEEKLDIANKTAGSPRIIENPKPARIKGQKRELGKFYKLIIAIAAIFVVLGVIFAGVFGSAAASANKAEKLDRAEAEQIAQDFVYRLAQDEKMGLPLVPTRDDIKLYNTDHDMHYNAARPLDSYNVYEIIFNVVGTRIEVEVDTRTGDCAVTDIDT